MKEIRRRAFSSMDEGMACGPFSSYAVDAEIVIEEEGKEMFLHAQWVNLADDELLIEASTESLYDHYAKIEEVLKDKPNDSAAFEKAIADRDDCMKRSMFDLSTEDIREKYPEQYEALLNMIQEVMDQDESGCDIRECIGEDEFDEELDDGIEE